MTTHPAAYLRRSYVDKDSPGDISEAAQRAAVQKLSRADGHNGDVVEYNDWGVSADIAKSAKRIDYTRLLADMEAGRISAVYAFDVDRLYRDPRDLIRLQDAAQRHQVRIVTTGGPLAIGDGDDPAAEAFAFIGSVFGRLELRKAQKRARAGQAARRARGDVFGHPIYGFRHERDVKGRIHRVRDESVDITPVLDAYAEAGTVLGAVRLLNDRKVPTARGGESRWYTYQLTRVLEAHGVTLPPKGASGKRIKASAALSQLIRCHCGHVMTPNTHRRQLYCSRGHVEAKRGHGRYTVQEKDLLPLIEAKAATFNPDFDAVKEVVDPAAERAKLEDERRGVGDAVAIRAYTVDEGARRIEAIEAKLAALDGETIVKIVPTWDEVRDWPDADRNRHFKLLWTHVQLGDDMLPTPDGFVSKLPAEYWA